MAQHIRTPLLYSHPLSEIVGKQVFLKLELLQPSGSFKDRGIGNLCMHFAQKNDKGFIASSGGNAGMSVAFAGKKLKRKTTIIVPKTTSHMMIQKIRHLHAQVIVHGDNWNEADELALQKVEEEKLNYIPPFDHPRIWQGYESLIDEFVQDNYKPDVIILSVGGGGLFTGIVQGLVKHGWNAIPIITVEPEGAATLAKAIEKKEHITLTEIKTIAGTLGAKKIANEAYLWCQKWDVLPQ
ncbi:MAG TPA: pyridoxal-phosphate dependent enzyme, partial [Gammaproteobacteria bacterium]|nr:pyridoxal-phosphate dependent enzyme [Gammaproteobacteria bacterium]